MRRNRENFVALEKKVASIRTSFSCPEFIATIMRMLPTSAFVSAIASLCISTSKADLGWYDLGWHDFNTDPAGGPVVPQPAPDYFYLGEPEQAWRQAGPFQPTGTVIGDSTTTFFGNGETAGFTFETPTTASTYGTSGSPEVVPTNDGFIAMTQGSGDGVIFSFTNNTIGPGKEAFQVLGLYFNMALSTLLGNHTINVGWRYLGDTLWTAIADSIDIEPLVNNTANHWTPVGFDLFTQGIVMDAPGQKTVEFRIEKRTGSGDLFIDNILITAVPETSNVLALGLLMGSVSFVRFRRRQRNGNGNGPLVGLRA